MKLSQLIAHKCINASSESVKFFLSFSFTKNFKKFYNFELKYCLYNKIALIYGE